MHRPASALLSGLAVAAFLTALFVGLAVIS